MKIFKDKKVILLVMILMIFTIGYFIVVNKVSYAFSNNYNLETAYDNVIKTIKECAIAYGKNNSKLFEEDDIVYIKVQDLIDSNLLIANIEGNITNPLKENATLNSNIIKIKKENEKFTVEVDG